MAEQRRRLRLAILAYNLRAAGGLSVGKNVISALSRVADHHDYLLLMPGGLQYEALRKPTNASSHYYHRTRGPLGQLDYEWRVVPRLVREHNADVVWGLGNVGLRHPPAKQAILMHKPQYIYEARFQRRERWRYRFVNRIGWHRLNRSLPKTQLVFCQTKTASERFRKAFQYNGQMGIMPNAVSEFSVQGGTHEPAILETLRGKFVLFCLTRYYAHKNLEVLVDLFRRHRDRLQDVAIILTIQEDQHPGARGILEALAEPELAGRIINIGPVDQRELAAYFTHCDGLILPTLLESFSGTYLEAMQFKCPILTSDLDFAHDVCGPAARYFDPFDTGSICDAILALKNDQDERGALVAAGTEWKKQFVRDWDSIVDQAVRQLEDLVVNEANPAKPA